MVYSTSPTSVATTTRMAVMNRDSHHNRPVIAPQRIDEQPAHAGIVEDRFGQDGAAKDAGDLKHHDGDERNQRIAGGVLDR